MTDTNRQIAIGARPRPPFARGRGGSVLLASALPSALSGEDEYWLSDVVRMDQGDNEWGFSIYANKGFFLAGFLYADRKAAEGARQAILPVLKHLIFLITTEH